MVKLPQAVYYQIIAGLALSISLLSAYTIIYQRKIAQALKKESRVERIAGAVKNAPQIRDSGAMAAEKTPVAPTTAPETPPEPAPRNIMFTYVDRRAQNVLVAGDFNSWQAQSMRQEKRGVWRIKTAIAPGFYRYHFIADNKTATDPYNPRKEDNYSLLLVEPLNNGAGIQSKASAPKPPAKAPAISSSHRNKALEDIALLKKVIADLKFNMKPDVIAMGNKSVGDAERLAAGGQYQKASQVATQATETILTEGIPAPAGP